MRVDEHRWARRVRRLVASLLSVAAALVAAASAQAGALRVVATLPDLADLAREIGGEEVQVKGLVGGGQDPHFIQAKPSFISALHRADLFVYNGLSLEIGWVPPLVQNARNSRILAGKPGDFDASREVPLLGVVRGGVDRSMGDVHAEGNPHYLLDPVQGLRVARRMRDRLSELRADKADYFGARYADFRRRLVVALVGEGAAERLGVEAIARAGLEGRLDAWLREAGAWDALGGWLGAVRPDQGAPVVADHDLWPYFAKRFGVRVVGFLEPLPGVTPSTRHLGALAAQMQAEHVSVILSAAYFHSRYARKLEEATGARMVEMANQVGARPGVETYLEMCNWNVTRLADALR